MVARSALAFQCLPLDPGLWFHDDRQILDRPERLRIAPDLKPANAVSSHNDAPVDEDKTVFSDFQLEAGIRSEAMKRELTRLVRSRLGHVVGADLGVGNRPSPFVPDNAWNGPVSLQADWTQFLLTFRTDRTRDTGRLPIGDTDGPGV
jgi:hypothetical protein